VRREVDVNNNITSLNSDKPLIIMHPSARLLRAHNPLIRFIGKRTWTTGIWSSGCLSLLPLQPVSLPEQPHSHPAAPAGLMPSPASSTTPSASGNAFKEFWQLPERIWHPRHRELQEAEIEAILVMFLPSPSCSHLTYHLLRLAEWWGVVTLIFS
jgi:small subunit ribosomal protein YMR-31